MKRWTRFFEEPIGESCEHERQREREKPREKEREREFISG
jgi:hypothetical protein